MQTVRQYGTMEWLGLAVRSDWRGDARTARRAARQALRSVLRAACWTGWVNSCPACPTVCTDRANAAQKQALCHVEIE